MTDDNETIAELQQLVQTDSVEHIWEDGEYRGALVTFSNPIRPELKQIFHPYMPLIIAGQEPPRLTRAYFIENGWAVPGEPTVFH